MIKSMLGSPKNEGERRRAAAADIRFVSEGDGCVPFAPPCGLGAGASCSTGVCLWSVAIRAKPGNRKARSHANAPLRHETFSTSGFVNASASARPTVRVNALRNNGMTFPCVKMALVPSTDSAIPPTARHILACAASELSQPGRQKLKSSQDLRHTSSDGRPASFVRRRSRRSSTTRITRPCLCAKGLAVSIVRINGLENTFVISSGSRRPANSSACCAPTRLKNQSEKRCAFFGRHCAWRIRYRVIRLLSPNFHQDGSRWSNAQTHGALIAEYGFVFRVSDFVSVA